MPAAPAVLVIAQSARAIASALARAGRPVVAIDYFSDQDLCSVALYAERYNGNPRCGFSAMRLIPQIEQMVARLDRPLLGILVGSGFEDRPKLLARIARHWPLLGASPGSVERAKSPEFLADLCQREGIPRPAMTRVVPPQPDSSVRWLMKRRGASGGAHVHDALPGAVPAGHYAEAFKPGESWSLFAFSDGRQAVPVGFCRQFFDPTPDQPYRFSGLAGPMQPPLSVESEIIHSMKSVAKTIGIKGYFGIDFILDHAGWWLIEVNPRPTAALDIFDPIGEPLFADGRDGPKGRAPASRKYDATIRATKVLYATAEIGSLPFIHDWIDILDVPTAGFTIGQGEPVVTLVAEAATLEDALARLGGRAREILRILGG